MKGAAIATHSGVVVTSTTELVTDVNSRDLIQEEKWIARKNPETTVNHNKDLGKDLISLRNRTAITGNKINAARLKRYAAITIEDASFWANLMKMDALDTAKIPINNPKYGESIGDLLDFFTKLDLT